MDGGWLMSVVLAIILGGGVLFLVIAWRRVYHKQTVENSQARPRATSQDQHKAIAGLIEEVLPIHPNTGWNLEGIHNGIRVFSRQLDSLQSYSSEKHLVAASLILDGTLKRAVSLVTSVREMSCWTFGPPLSNHSPPSLVQQSSACSHVIQFTMMRQHLAGAGLLHTAVWRCRLRMASALAKYAPSLEGLLGPAPQRITTETVERFWHYDEGGLCYMFSRPRLPSFLPYEWSCMCFTPLKQPGMCLATMVMCPAAGAGVKELITGELCALRQHVTMRAFKVYSRHSKSPKPTGGGVGVKGEGKVPLENRQLDLSEASKPPVPTLEDRFATPPPSSITPPPSSIDAAASTELLSNQLASSGKADDQSSAVTEADRPTLQTTTTPPQQPIPTPAAVEVILSLPPSPEEILNTKYLNMAEEKTNLLVTMSKEGAEDGWLEVGTTKDVHVMKKLPAENEPPINSVKGRGTIAAPPEFLVRILADPVHVNALDELLKEARLIQEISTAVTLVHLLYKAVWPTSPRDIAVLSVMGKVEASTWVSCGNSIVDDRIPPEKGYVRADLIIGGYVLHSVPDNPEMSDVTYCACINMKGNIPAFAVNKIAESQPMCINHLRNLAVPLYKKMKADPAALLAFEKKFPVSLIVPPKTPDTASHTSLEPVAASLNVVTASNGAAHNGLLEPLATSAPPAQPTATTLQDRLANSQWHFDPSSNQATGRPGAEQNGLEDSVDGGFTTPPISSDEEGEVISKAAGAVAAQDTSVPETTSAQEIASFDSLPEEETKSPVSSTPSTALLLSQYTPGPGSPEDSTTYQSITKENIYYPRHDSGQVDYRTLANQTAARVLEEVFHVSNIDLLSPTTYQLAGGWSFAGLEKDILLLSKNSPDQSFSSFMGKGIIPLSPQFVFDSLRNPQLRFMYDNMLKELHIVKHIEEGLFILHLQHETTQCFIKQARDFCILVSERSEHNKKMLTGFSIETPDCPPNPNMHRGKVYYSGWVVEPKQVKGKLWAEVTYLLQVDMGRIPGPLINLISKRQPLAVAYLRDYLVSTSLEHSSQS